MKNNDNIRDELNELSPFLAKRKGMEEGFKVPKDYFSTLPDEVMKRVRPEASPIAEPQRDWLDGVAGFFQNLFQPRYALAYASVAVLIAAGVYFFSPPEDPALPVANFENISDEALESYLSENIDAFSTDLLEAHFAESSHLEGRGGGGKNLPGLEMEELENYLDNTLDEIDLDDLEDLL